MVKKITKLNKKIKKMNPMRLYAYWIGIVLLSLLIIGLILWASCRPHHPRHGMTRPNIEIAAAQQPYEIMQKANKHFNKGIRRMNKKDYRGAVKEYSKAIKLNDRNSAYFIARADAALSRGDAMLAKSDLSRGIMLTANEISNSHSSLKDPVYRGKVQVLANLLQTRGIVKSENGDAEGASKDFDAADKLQTLLNQQQRVAKSVNMSQQRPVRTVPIQVQGANGETKVLYVPEGGKIVINQAGGKSVANQVLQKQQVTRTVQPGQKVVIPSGSVIQLKQN